MLARRDATGPVAAGPNEMGRRAAGKLPGMSASSDAADLASLARTTDTVLARLRAHADRYAHSDRADVYGALHEAERTLRATVRSIEQATKLLS